MNRKLYIGNLSPSLHRAELQALLGQAGRVVSILVMRDDTSGRARSIAYVEMQSDDGARAAVARFNQYPFQGLTLTVTASSDNPGADLADVLLHGPESTATLGMLDEGGPPRWGD